MHEEEHSLHLVFKMNDRVTKKENRRLKNTLREKLNNQYLAPLKGG